MADILGSLLGYQNQELQNQALMDTHAEKQLEIQAVQNTTASQQAFKSLLQQGIQDQLAPAQQKAQQQQKQVQQQQQTQNDPFAATLQMGQNLVQAAAKLQAQYPEMAEAKAKEGQELIKNAVMARKEQLSSDKAELEQVNMWAKGIQDQSTLDAVKAEVEQIHPGSWEQHKLPSTYTGNEQVFKSLGTAFEDPIKQKERDLKDLELYWKPIEEQTKQEKAHFEEANIRSEIATRRERLDREVPKATAQDKYQADLEKETALYEKEKLGVRNAVSSTGTAKYSTKTPAKAGVLRDNPIINYFGGAPAEAAKSPQQQALDNVEEAHQARLTAIQTRAAAKGVIPPRPTPAPSSKASSEASTPTSLPSSKADLKVGQVYDTPRGKAKWNGSMFEAQ